MLEAMAHLVPALSWLIPIPFYFMELLVGVVQALVFMLLTAVFTLLIAQHEPPRAHTISQIFSDRCGWTTAGLNQTNQIEKI
jgi:F-type H+-transporting ATPase subunit a